MNIKVKFFGNAAPFFIGAALLLCVSTLSSCLHKEVMTDRADNIEWSILYQGKEGNYIICKEMVFQARSKSSSGGITATLGQEQYRLSSYELATGKLSARVNFSTQVDDDQLMLLGATPGKLWLYCLDKEPGLHCRDPKTLKIIAGQQEITRAFTLKALPLASPPILNFSWELNKPIITDAAGYNYYINPDDYSIQKTDDKLINERKFANRHSFFSTSFQNITLDGDNRRALEFNHIEKADNPSFLFGQFVLDNNPYRSGLRLRDVRAAALKRLEKLQDSVLTNEKATKGKGKAGFDNSDDKGREKATGMASNIKNDLRNQERNPQGHLLSDGPSAFLICSADMISDSARIVISKLKQLDDHSFSEVWKCRLSHLYFDPNVLEKSRNHESIFSKGDPHFKYQWFDMAYDKLVMILQLQMACIDMKTGKLTWEINL